MNKQKQKTKLTAKKRHNTNKTLKRKNLVAGYGLKTKSSKKRTNTRRTIRPQDNGVPQEGDNQEASTIPPAYPPITPYSQPEVPPIPPYEPPTPYESVKPYEPPPAYEPIQPYSQPEIPPVKPYEPPPAFAPIPEYKPAPPYESPPVTPPEEPVTPPEEPVTPPEEPVTPPEEPVTPPEEPVTKPSIPAYEPVPAYTQPEIPPVQPYEPGPAFEPIPAYVQPTEIPPVPPYIKPPAFEPIPEYVQPTEIPPIQPYEPPPAFAPIPPFQNSITPETPPEEPEISVINQESFKPEELKNGFTETIIPNNQPPTNNTINVELCPTIIEVGKNINHKYMFPSQFPVITNFYKQMPENSIENKKRI